MALLVLFLMPFDLNILTNLGIGSASLIIIYVMLKYFMKSLDRKDEVLNQKDVEMKKLIEDFQGHVEICNTNFMKYSEHFSKVSGKQLKAMSALTSSVNILIDKVNK